MTGWAMLGIVSAGLLVFWLWLGTVFDGIDWINHHYHREQAVADRSGEDLSPTEGKGSSL